MAEVTSRMHALEVAAEAYRGRPPDEVVDAAERFARFLDTVDAEIFEEVVDERPIKITFDEAQAVARAWIGERGLNARLAVEFAVDADPKGAVIGFTQAAGGPHSALNLLLAHLGVSDSERVELCLRASCAERWAGEVVERTSGVDNERKPWTRVELLGDEGAGPRKGATVVVVWGPEPF